MNLLTFTQQFDNAAWTKTAATVTANTTAAPDGTSTADTLTEDTTAVTAHRVLTTVAVAAAAHTASIYVKAGTRSWFYIRLTDSGAVQRYAYFNVGAGTLGTVETNLTASITDAGNGWYRCVATVNVAATSLPVVFAITDGNNSQVYTGNGTGSLFCWGAQLEAASAATTYTRNNGGVFPPRFDYDPVTLAPKGILIEEQRTNLLTYSEQFNNAAWFKGGTATVTANSVTAPDGTLTADTIVLGTVGDLIIQDYSTTVNATYVASIYLRAASPTTVILTVQQSGGGSASVTCAVTTSWQRFEISRAMSTLTFVRTVIATNSNTPTIFAWGAQMEAGAFATSYIPTVASQVTRTADQTSIVAPNFAPWYNQSEGTFVAEYSGQGTVGSYAFAANDGGSYYVATAFQTPTNIRSIANSVAGYNFVGTTGGAAGSVNKTAFGYRTNDLAASTNGATPATSGTATIPPVNRLTVGSYGSFAYINGHIRSIRYYPIRLSNAQLQALTA